MPYPSGDIYPSDSLFPTPPSLAVRQSSRIRPAILALEPWAYWRLNETQDTAEGGVTARDQSGHLRNAEYRNSPELAAPGLATGDPAFSVGLVEASKSYVKAIGVLPFTGSKTFFALVKRRAAHTGHDAILSSSQGSGNLVLLYIPEGTSDIRLLTAGFAGTNATWSGAWPGDEAVVDVALTVNPATGKAILYVNGVSKGEKSVAAWGAEPKEIRLGQDGSTGGFNAAWAGWMQDFAVFEGLLSAEQIAALHEARTTAPAALSTRRYWGADMDGDAVAIGNPDAPYSLATWEAFEAQAGRPVGIVHFADPWLTWDGYGSGASARVVTRGAIPMKTIGSDGEGGIVARVIAGEEDARIDQWASEAMAFGHPIFCRLWWEMNLTGVWDWNVPPAEYVEGWRHFVDRVRAIADNVTFNWSFNFLTTGEDEEEVAEYYPGDDYVDWVGFDGYTGTHPAKSFGWREPYVLFGRSHDLMKTLAPTKPILVGEFASSEVGGDKAAWLKKILRGDGVDQMPRIRGLVYFNWNIEHNPPGLRVDWPIDSSPEAQAAFADGIGSPLYSDPPNTGELPYVQPHSTILPITPVVTIASGPKSQSPEDAATFVFTADMEEVTFEYRLDGGEWVPATSPVTVEGLTEAQHTFEVRAAEADEIPGVPTVYTWRRPGTRPLKPGEVPKLAVPLRAVGGRLATVEQDSEENVAAAVYAILAYERGSRIEDADFGVESPVFETIPLDVSEWLEQISKYEPRAEVETKQDVEELIGDVLVNVGVRS